MRKIEPEESPSHPPPNNVPYLIAVVIMSTIGVVSTIAVMLLRPNADNATLYASIAAFVGPTTVAILTFMKSDATHVLVNGRMEEFKRLLQAKADQDEAEARQEGAELAGKGKGKGREKQ